MILCGRCCGQDLDPNVVGIADTLVFEGQVYGPGTLCRNPPVAGLGPDGGVIDIVLEL